MRILFLDIDGVLNSDDYFARARDPEHALDDEPDMGPLTHRLVATDPVYGLTDSDCSKLVELLSQS